MAYKDPRFLAENFAAPEETRESALAKIGKWANDKSQYDWDDGRSYLTNDESDYIKNAVNKYGITKSELRGLHPHFFHPGSYGSYGIEDNAQTLEQYENSLGRKPTEDEYKNWIKPRIATRVGEYKKQGLDEKSALAELDDEFGYDDLVREAYYGRPKRSDIEIWRDRLKNTNVEPYTKNLSNLSDEQVQQLIDAFGFDRKGEW